MPGAQLKLGPTTLTLNASADLSSLATKPIIMSVLSHLTDFDGLLNTPIGQVPKFSVPARIEFGDTGAWSLAGQSQALTVSVDAGISGALALIPAGESLFQFPQNADGSPGRVQTAARENRPCPYLRVSLSVKYSVDAGAAFSFGTVGISGSASAGRVFTIDNYIPCDPTMPLTEAIGIAFNSFVLPFHSESATTMTDGAFLDYVFSGKIAFGAGLNYSFSIAAASLGQLKTSFDSPLLTAGLAPAINAGPSLNVRFEVNDGFRIIIGRRQSSSQNRIHLCVGKVDKKALGLDLGVELSAGLGAEFDLQDTVNKVVHRAASSILTRASENTKAKALQSLNKAMGVDAVNKYIGEAQGQIDDFLNRVTTTKADFTVAYETSRTNTQLFNYVVDCDVPAALSSGYAAALQCDFLTAMKTEGVTLEVGSFLEDELTSKTTITFQFFNLLEAQDSVEFIQNLKTVYAGGGLFRVIYTTGVDWQNVFNKRSEDVKVFFEATSETSDQVTYKDATITLNFVMTDSNDAHRSALTAKVLRLLNNPELTTLADKIASDVQVTAQLLQDSFSSLEFDEVQVGNHLNPGSHDRDKRNYETFVAAVDAIRPDIPFGRGLRRYEDWVTFNRSANDRSGSTRPPDRANPGNLAVWPQEFLSISDSSTRLFIGIDFEAARQFMNLCEFLDRLSTDTLDNPGTKEFFNKLLESLSSAIRNSPTVLTWYSKACFSALARLMLAKVTHVEGLIKPGNAVEISFELENQVPASANARI